MDLSQHTKKIERLFDAYEALQARHLELMKAADLSNVKAMNTERQEASDALQAALNQFMENAGSMGQDRSLPLLSAFESRLTNIMALDERIASEIERHRGKMREHLKQMKQGKNAMNGYKSAAKAPDRPRVFKISR